MKIVCISDTHMRDLGELPEGDILVHCGDLSFMGTWEQLTEAKLKLEKEASKFKHRILIPGNHDFMFMKDWEGAKEIFNTWNILLNSSIELEGIKFWGSPVTPTFARWAFEAYSSDRRTFFSGIPEGTDIVLTHGPPFGILDGVPRIVGTWDDEQGFVRETVEVENVGCYILKENIERVKPKYHIFGHIHEGYGTHEESGIKFINCALCDEDYKLSNQPVVIEV